MKNARLLLLLLLLPTMLLAQNGNSKEVSYETMFTEENGVNHLYLLVNKKELAKVERMYILVGSSLGLGDLNSLMIDKKTFQKERYDPRDEMEKKINRVGNNICIHLGDFNPGKCYVTMYTREKNKKPKKAKS